MFTERDLNNPPVQPSLRRLKADLFDQKELALYVLVFENGPLALKGNKWAKLKYNLLEASRLNIKTLLTFGGAWSNHIAATACASKIYGFKSIGIIRGEETLPLNKTLREAQVNGMQLYYENRLNYREKENTEYHNHLKNRFGEIYIIPEGGSNPLGVKGVSEIINGISTPFDYIICACGTGATLAGLANGLKRDQSAVGISVLKSLGFLNGNLLRFTDFQEGKMINWKIIEDFHFGGYARHTNELLDFIRLFFQDHKIVIEPVYTGKLFFGLYELIKKDYFKKGSSLIVFHSGGLQYIED